MPTAEVDAAASARRRVDASGLEGCLTRRKAALRWNGVATLTQGTIRQGMDLLSATWRSTLRKSPAYRSQSKNPSDI